MLIVEPIEKDQMTLRSSMHVMHYEAMADISIFHEKLEKKKLFSLKKFNFDEKFTTREIIAVFCYFFILSYFLDDDTLINICFSQSLEKDWMSLASL